MKPSKSGLRVKKKSIQYSFIKNFIPCHYNRFGTSNKNTDIYSTRLGLDMARMPIMVGE